MTYYTGSYEPPIGGVSQQHASSRLPTQVERQENMLSDVIMGVRRRGGFSAHSITPERNPVEGAVEFGYIVPAEHVGALYLQVIMRSSELVLRMYEWDTDTGEPTGPLLGNVTVDGTYDLTRAQEYLDVVSAGEALIILDRGRVVTAHTPTPTNQPSAGWFYIQAGQFKFTYSIRVAGKEFSYTTVSVDSGTGLGDETKITPEYIADKLMAEIDSIPGYSDLQKFREGAYVYLQGVPEGGSDPVAIEVTTPLSNNYLVTSAKGRLGSTALLPGKLPAQADGYTIAIGVGDASVYYKYMAEDRLWDETVATGAATELHNMPIVLEYSKDTGQYHLNTGYWESRQSGDANNNPEPHFVGRRLTGIGYFQGRLVLLCGEYVHMSATNKPYRFYRSSVALLKDDDPIEVASTRELDDDLVHAVQYNSNLVLFGKRTQAVVPGGTVLTPRNTMIDIAARHEVDTSIKPVLSGRSLMFASYGSGFSRVWEIVPDDNISTYITPVDITMHLPTYIKGRLRHLIPSQHSNMLVAVAEDGDMYINEYVWEGDTKVTTAWHRWNMANMGTVLAGRFDGARLHLLCTNSSDDWTGFAWETNPGAIGEAEKLPHLDKLIRAECTSPGELTVPPRTYVEADTEQLVMYIIEGTDAYIPSKPVEVSGDYYQGWTIAAPWLEVGDVYYLGVPYTSVLAPTRPIIRDHKDQPINTERAQLHKLTLSVVNTGEFVVDAIDTARDTSYEDTAVRLYARELDAGKPLMATTPVNIICRLDMRTAVVQFSTDGVYDMNIVTIEYGYRHNRRYRRG